MIKALLITWAVVSLGLLLSLYRAASRSANNHQPDESYGPSQSHLSRRTNRGRLEEPLLDDDDGN